MPDNQTIDQHLDDVTIKQLTFKGKTAGAIAHAICLHFIIAHQPLFSDEVDLNFVGADSKNCVGIVWRQLARLKVITQLQEHRRSENKARRGGVVFKYALESPGLARKIIRLNGGQVPDPQTVLV